MSKDRAEKMLFAFAPAESNDSKVPLLTFLMPEQAWQYMHDGLCHEFDLTQIGIPIQVIIGRCKDHAQGAEILETLNGGALRKLKDVRDVSVKFGQKPTQQ
jgi:hypothetical protein